MLKFYVVISLSQTDAHTKALKKAAQKAIERENAQSKSQSSGVEEQGALAASKLLEKAYTGLYQRIQDTTARDEAWKANLLDCLEKVRH